MTRIAYFDCFSGASGDMIVGALLDAGLDLADLRKIIRPLELHHVRLEAVPVVKHGFRATHFQVHIGDPPRSKKKHSQAPGDAHGTPHGVRYSELAARLLTSRLESPVKRRAMQIFQRLAEAEARVHGTTPARVHLHEVGGEDALVDIVGAAAGLQLLGIERVACSPLPAGGGWVRAEHGTLPVPAPGTAELLRGFAVAASDSDRELTTPTGAAILTTLAAKAEPLPSMRVARIGYGAGTRDLPDRPNCLRLFLGEAPSGGGKPAGAEAQAAGADESDWIWEVETNLDNVTGDAVAFALERLFEVGALDVYTAPLTMKKSRPGLLLGVLVEPGRLEAVEDVLFRHTPTFGVRKSLRQRAKLAREIRTVATPLGPVRVKLGSRRGVLLKSVPEFEDVQALARGKNVSLARVLDVVEDALGKEGLRPVQEVRALPRREPGPRPREAPRRKR